MVTITLPEELVQRLEALAEQEQRSVVDIVSSMVENYEPHILTQEESDEAFKAIFGIYDDDVTDMSATVRETLQKYFQEKYGRPD